MGAGKSLAGSLGEASLRSCAAPPLPQVLSDGEEGLPGSSLPQLDARLFCLPLLLPALQEPGAHQLPRVSGSPSPTSGSHGGGESPALGQGSASCVAAVLTCTTSWDPLNSLGEKGAAPLSKKGTRGPELRSGDSWTSQPAGPPLEGRA